VVSDNTIMRSCGVSDNTIRRRSSGVSDNTIMRSNMGFR